MIEDKYSAGLVSQSFWFIEFKKIAFMLKEGKNKEEIKKICLDNNLLGAVKEYRAKRMYAYIINRINRLDDELLDLFVCSDLSTQKLINLICILRGDRLFTEFLYEVYREKIMLGYTQIEDKDLNVFFNDKANQNEDINSWVDSTKKRLKGIYVNYMVDANLLYVENKNKIITVPIIDTKLERYLLHNNEEILLKALTGVR